MRKKLFIIVSLILILNNYLISQNSFSAKINFPSVITQGESVLAILDIYKPKGLRNYTVFTQKLPAGFYVKAVDLKGASMTYENNELVLTWLRIPEDEKLSVSYEISTMTGLSGIFNLTGNISYMVNGNLGQFDLQSFRVEVRKKKENTSVSEKTDEYAEIPRINYTLSDLKCSRTIVFNKRKKLYDIEIKITKQENCSYVIVEKFPKNFKFSESQSNGAQVTIYNSSVRYYWKNLYGSKEFIISYQLEPMGKQVRKPIISGKFSMLKDGHIYNIPVYTID